MIVFQDMAFDRMLVEIRKTFLEKGVPVDVGEWQSIKNPDLPMSKTYELQNISIQIRIPEQILTLQKVVKPNLPWAEDHFQERVSGIPYNPPPSHEWWPFAQKSNKEHIKNNEFSHTYPERFWPKFAGYAKTTGGVAAKRGIRYEYGDLGDIVEQLTTSPGTRQAYLPVWFPEDTGATHGERVPCTLGYHFLIRYERLYINYYIRSCDLLRHFQDDVYMAARLAQWVVAHLNKAGFDNLRPGSLTMHIASLHIFQGEEERLKREMDAWQAQS